MTAGDELSPGGEETSATPPQITTYKTYVWPNVQSAIATSGYGVVYQNAVGGLLLGYLAASAPFGKLFPNGQLIRVGFQRRLENLMLDDVVVAVKLADAVTEHVAIQITLDLDMVASDDKYRAVLGASLFTHNYNKPYYYGFITQADTAALWRLTLSALTCEEDPEKWLADVNEPNNYDPDVRRALVHLRNGLAPNMPDQRQPTAHELVAFLQRFMPITVHVGAETDEQGALMRALLSGRYGLSDSDAQLLLDA